MTVTIGSCSMTAHDRSDAGKPVNQGQLPERIVGSRVALLSSESGIAYVEDLVRSRCRRMLRDVGMFASQLETIEQMLPLQHLPDFSVFLKSIKNSAVTALAQQ